MLDKEAYQLAQIIYGEKKREKFETTIDDQLTGFRIFSAQAKIEEYGEIFHEIVKNDSVFRLN